MSAGQFSGSIVAIVTPLREDGQVDFDAFARLLDWHVAGGTAGVVIAGTTGESPTVSDTEILELIRRSRAQIGTRMQIIVGAGSNSTAAAVQRARELSAVAVDALLVVTPAYNKPTQEGLYLHFAAVAAASSAPVILYNVPSRTGVDLLAPTVLRLSQLPRIAALKEAVPSLDRIRELVSLCGPEFVVLSGDDPTAREAVLQGARGVISVTANVAAAGMSTMVAAALRGDRAEAARIDATLAPLHSALFIESNPIPVKYALARLGLAGETLRLPLTPLSAQHRPRVDDALRAAGLLDQPMGRRASMP